MSLWALVMGCCGVAFACAVAVGQQVGQELTASGGARLVAVAPGWAGNSVNATIFRKYSLTTHDQWQYIAFYDPQASVVLGRRALGSNRWTLQTTQYKGNVRDAHNSISLAVDGSGRLHVAWDHHNSPLRYARSLEAGSLQLGPKLPMSGVLEDRVTYPEFYNLPDGGLLFFYRDGASGQGNLAVKAYDPKSQKWTQLQHNLIDGQEQRSAYWQVAVDQAGTIHLSWVWRETADVATNHDLCYARSTDGGKSWHKTTGQMYQLPITEATAEIAAHIPQRHELMNQTSMAADSRGRPYIATYWRPMGTDVPQYQLVYHDGQQWRIRQVGQRKTGFRLGGGGTRRVPISRPQLMVHASDRADKACLVFRNEERGNRVSVAWCEDLSAGQWRVEDLTNEPVGQWEPSFDQRLWQREHQLHLFVQRVEQRDAEAVAAVDPTMVYVLEWTLP